MTSIKTNRRAVLAGLASVGVGGATAADANSATACAAAFPIGENYDQVVSAEDRMRHHLGMAGLALLEMYPGPGRFEAMVCGSRTKDLSFHLCLYQPTAEHPEVEFITQRAWGAL